MEFLDYIYLKFRKNFLSCLNEITDHDFHLRKVSYRDSFVSDYVTYIIQGCDFKDENDSFPILVLIEWKIQPFLGLLGHLLEDFSEGDAEDFSKEILNISIGHLKGQLDPQHYAFQMARPKSSRKKEQIPGYDSFISLEKSYEVCLGDEIYGLLSFYFEEE